jgi:nitroreductase
MISGIASESSSHTFIVSPVVWLSAIIIAKLLILTGILPSAWLVMTTGVFMETIDAILTRRSIRAYTGQTVSPETIDLLLKAAMQAPSAGNQQAWQFVVITDRGRLNSLAEVLPYGKMLPTAPLSLVVCGDLSLEKSRGYWVQDCSAATQNILLAAHALGLGAVWLGVYPREERVRDVRNVLGIPDTVIPLCAIAIGYPAEQKPRTERYNSERVHTNTWKR